MTIWIEHIDRTIGLYELTWRGWKMVRLVFTWKDAR